MPQGRPARPTDANGTEPVRIGGCLLHEWAFGALLAFLAWHFVRELGPRDPAMWFPVALIAIDAGLIRLDQHRQSNATARARLLFHAVAMNIVYFRLGIDVPRTTGGWHDAQLIQLDRHWLGETPAVLLRPAANPFLTELLSLCYLLFYPAMLGYQLDWVRGPLPAARRFFVGLYLIYAAGFLGYTILPAKGPWLQTDPALPPLVGGPIHALTDFVVRSGCNGVDVFPSLHAAVAAYFIGFDFIEGRRRRFFRTLPSTLGLCLATMYLGYHYAVDVVAGLALTAAALALSRWGTCTHRSPAAS